MILITEIQPQDVGRRIRLEGIILSKGNIEPILQKGTFKCQSCLRVSEVEEKTSTPYQPEVCIECGGKTFELLPNESKFTEKQILQLQIISREEPLQVILYDSLCSESYTIGTPLLLEGTLCVAFDTQNYYYVNVEEIL